MGEWKFSSNPNVYIEKVMTVADNTALCPAFANISDTILGYQKLKISSKKNVFEVAVKCYNFLRRLGHLISGVQYNFIESKKSAKISDARFRHQNHGYQYQYQFHS